MTVVVLAVERARCRSHHLATRAAVTTQPLRRGARSTLSPAVWAGLAALAAVVIAPDWAHRITALVFTAGAWLIWRWAS